MTTIKTLIVDDEPLAISSLKSLLAALPDIHLLAPCNNGFDAVESIQFQKPDLVFLDINMPGIDGMEVVRRIKDHHPPLIVFVTAYDRFAVEAFELRALDYLLKPFVDERLMEAVERARTRLLKKDGPSLPEQLEGLLADLAPQQTARTWPTRLVVKEPGRSRIVLVDEITWIGSAGNYVELHMEDRSLLHRQSMDAMELALDPSRFIRIHRSTIVNINEVAEVTTPDRSRELVILRDGQKLKVALSSRDRLRSMLETT